MAGIDRPWITFSDALDIVGVIQQNKIESLDNLATKLGHKTSNSGGFHIKVASLAKYGLADRSRGKVRLTPLALKILMPIGGDKEKYEACREAIFRVPLLKRLYERLEGKEVRKDDLWSHLYEISGDREASVQQASAVHTIYQDAMTYVRKAEQLAPTESRTAARRPVSDVTRAALEDLDAGLGLAAENPPVAESMIRLESGNTVIQLPRTEVNIKIIKSALDAMVPQLGPDELLGATATPTREKKASAPAPDTKAEKGREPVP